MNKLLTVGMVAAFFQVPRWRVQRLIERGLLAPSDRIGKLRVFVEADLGKVQDA